MLSVEGAEVMLDGLPRLNSQVRKWGCSPWLFGLQMTQL